MSINSNHGDDSNSNLTLFLSIASLLPVLPNLPYLVTLCRSSRRKSFFRQLKVARLQTAHLVWKNNGTIELANFFSQDRKKIKALKCYNRNFDWYSGNCKKKSLKHEILFRENGSINFLKFFFAVRRIITLLFAIIKFQFNTLRFAKIPSTVFVSFIFNEKIQWRLSSI